MECIFGFIVVVVALSALMMFGVGQFVGLSKSQAYSLLAKKYHGELTRGYIFGRPKVRFRYGTEPFCVWAPTVGDSSHVVVTQIECKWPDQAFFCEVFTSGFPVTKSTVPMSTRTNWLSKINGHFCVRTNDERLAERFLSEGVQWELAKLLAIRADHQMYLGVERGKLCIRKLGHLKRFEYLDEFTLVGLELFDQAMLTRSEGIEFLDAGAAQIIDEARCQVCGEDILSDMVFCRRCKTPHHLDCWQYNGSCSIFGCQETRYAVPVVANPAVDRRSAEDET